MALQDYDVDPVTGVRTRRRRKPLGGGQAFSMADTFDQRPRFSDDDGGLASLNKTLTSSSQADITDQSRRPDTLAAMGEAYTQGERRYRQSLDDVVANLKREAIGRNVYTSGGELDKGTAENFERVYATPLGEFTRGLALDAADRQFQNRQRAIATGQGVSSAQASSKLGKSTLEETGRQFDVSQSGMLGGKPTMAGRALTLSDEAQYGGYYDENDNWVPTQAASEFETAQTGMTPGGVKTLAATGQEFEQGIRQSQTFGKSGPIVLGTETEDARRNKAIESLQARGLDINEKNVNAEIAAQDRRLQQAEDALYGGSLGKSFPIRDLDNARNTKRGDPGYRVEFDVNQDGVIDNSDIQTVRSMTKDIGGGVLQLPGRTTLAAGAQAADVGFRAGAATGQVPLVNPDGTPAIDPATGQQRTGTTLDAQRLGLQTAQVTGKITVKDAQGKAVVIPTQQALNDAVDRAVKQGETTGTYVDPVTGVSYETLTSQAQYGGAKPVVFNKSDLTAAIGKSKGQPGYREEFDVNRDGTIGYDDTQSLTQGSEDIGGGRFQYRPGPRTLAGAGQDIETRFKQAEVSGKIGMRDDAGKPMLDAAGNVITIDTVQNRISTGDLTLRQAGTYGEGEVFDPATGKTLTMDDGKGGKIAVTKTTLDQQNLYGGVVLPGGLFKSTLPREQWTGQQKLAYQDLAIKSRTQADAAKATWAEITGVAAGKPGTMGQSEFKQAFEDSGAGRPFDPAADFNQDGLVDMDDMFLGAESGQLVTDDQAPVPTLEARKLSASVKQAEDVLGLEKNKLNEASKQFTANLQKDAAQFMTLQTGYLYRPGADGKPEPISKADGKGGWVPVSTVDREQWDTQVEQWDKQFAQNLDQFLKQLGITKEMLEKEDSATKLTAWLGLIGNLANAASRIGGVVLGRGKADSMVGGGGYNPFSVNIFSTPTGSTLPGS